MKKTLFLVALTLILTLTFTSVVFAKRQLPFLTKTTTTSKSTAPTQATGRVTSSAKFRSDRRAIIINFGNLETAQKVDYFLTYNTRGTTQGASGTLIPAGQSTTSRELLFGTCSKGVCRYDTGLTNAKLTVTSRLTNGKKIVKIYRLKV